MLYVVLALTPYIPRHPRLQPVATEPKEPLTNVFIIVVSTYNLEVDMVLVERKKKAEKVLRRGDLAVVVYDGVDLDQELLESVKEYLEGHVLTVEKVAEEVRREKASGKED